MLYGSWTEMTLHAIRTLRHSDVNAALALFEELKSNKVTQWGIHAPIGNGVVEAAKILRGAKPAPMSPPATATPPNMSQGWHHKESIKTGVHDAMCRADGNDIYLEDGFMEKASRFYTPQEFAEMVVEQSRNLKWRVDGCESWLPQSYLHLLVSGWSSRRELPTRAVRRKPTAFEGDVIAELRKIAIKEFTTLSAAAGEPLFQSSGQLIEGRTASELARAAINQAKSRKWRIPGYEKWMAYDYLHYLVRHCLDHDQHEHHAVVDELKKVLPDFSRGHGHIY
jgi:hypothetical protein